MMSDARGLAVAVAAVLLAMLTAGCFYIRIAPMESTEPAPTPTPTPVATLSVTRVTPWAVTEGLISSLSAPDAATVTYDANAPSIGSVLPLRLDGSGSTAFSESSEQGAASTVCAEGGTCSESACPGTPDVCAETSPECDGPFCSVQGGNLVGSFKTAIDYRLANTDAACDEFDEAIGTTGGVYFVQDECNPVTTGNLDSRLMVLPVVDSFCTPTCTVRIKDFATFWLDGYNASACAGSECEVNLRFVSPSPAW